METNKNSLEPSLEKNLKGHRSSITALQYSPHEHQIATGSLDHSVLLWDLRGTLRSYRFQGHNEAVMDVTFSPSGKYMASGSRDKSVRLWVPTVTGSTGVFKAHSQTVRSVQFNSDSSKILTASDDKIVKLWNTDKLKFISSFIGHTNWVRCARFTSDDSVIASCSDDNTVRLWDPQTGLCIHTYREQKGNGLHLAWHPSGCYIAVATSQGNVKLYDIRTHSLVQYYSIHSDAVTQVAFHPSGSYILTASKDGKMKILDLLEGHPLFTLTGHNGAVNTVSFSPTGDSFASAGDDKLVFVWRTNFTELKDEAKENLVTNQASTSRITSQTSAKFTGSSKQVLKGGNVWNKCYHSSRYPVSTFVHLDGINETTAPDFKHLSDTQGPNANSTFINSNELHTGSKLESITPIRSTPKIPHSQYTDLPSFNIGDLSHIPRSPPTQKTYRIPSLLNEDHNELFGMISLKENDVCYTSGTIEWVGKKRNFPINSGFKLLNDQKKCTEEPHEKKIKLGVNKIKECDCVDVLPTVNAIVDHLNALHEAVDIVDLRLNTLEDVVNEN